MAQIVEVNIPDIGDFKAVPVIEVFVKVGDTVAADASILTLESDKATIEIPSPVAGTVKEMRVKVGDMVSEGMLVLLVETSGESSAKSEVAAAPAAAQVSVPSPVPTPTADPISAPVQIPAAATATTPAAQITLPFTSDATLDAMRPAKGGESESAPATVHMPSPAELVDASRAHASPSIRSFARELGVDINQVNGSGPKGRILREDIQSYVKQMLSGAAAASPATASANNGGNSGNGGLDLLPWPKVDFAKFGPIEISPLSRIKKLSGANLARNWVMIPHVTQFDEADIGDLEAFRVALNKENEKNAAAAKLTMLAFLIKAAVAALKQFPQFNASLDADNLVLKQYYHIGFAADTPNGLVVPVIRDADRKGLFEIASEMAELSKKARDGKLSGAEMQGGCFTISSLGGIGGTAFTPIINAPEVAILGVSKSEMKPKWDGHQFVPRLMLPLSLSYDHRVIDGAAAARFTARLAQLLADLRRAML